MVGSLTIREAPNHILQATMVASPTFLSQRQHWFSWDVNQNYSASFNSHGCWVNAINVMEATRLFQAFCQEEMEQTDPKPQSKILNLQFTQEWFIQPAISMCHSRSEAKITRVWISGLPFSVQNSLQTLQFWYSLPFLSTQTLSLNLPS